MLLKVKVRNIRIVLTAAAAASESARNLREKSNAVESSLGKTPACSAAAELIDTHAAADVADFVLHGSPVNTPTWSRNPERSDISRRAGDQSTCA